MPMQDRFVPRFFATSQVFERSEIVPGCCRWKDRPYSVNNNVGRQYLIYFVVSVFAEENFEVRDPETLMPKMVNFFGGVAPLSTHR